MPEAPGGKWSEISECLDTCALTGAAAFAAGIRGAEILANGPLWCYFYALGYLERADYRLADRFHGSQPDNNAIVYGSEKFLLQTLRRLLERQQQPELLLLESSCSMSLIGDDLEGILRKAGLPFPAVAMDCGGMTGGFAEGYAAAGLKILEKFTGDTEDTDALPETAVNVLGLTDFYYNGAADRAEICRLLRKAGYHVQAVPGSGCTLEEMRHLGRARLNVVTNEELGLPLAEYLQRRFGTPWLLAGLPYGVRGTLAWLRRIHEALPTGGLDAVQAEAEETENFLAGRLNDARALWGRLWFETAVVSAPPVVALCLAQALRTEWADLGSLTVNCRHQLPSSAPGAYCDAADNVIIKGVQGGNLQGSLRQARQLLLLASSSESSFLYRQRHTDFLSCEIAFPVYNEIMLDAQPSAGLKGSVRMLQALWNGYIGQCLRRQN